MHSGRVATLIATALIGCALLTGCSAPPVAAPPSAPARFTMANLSDSSWDIVLSAKDGSVSRRRVGPRALVEEVLPEGDYDCEQVLLSSAGAPAARRTLSIRLVAGQTYRWRLTTLLAPAEVDEKPVGGNGPG